MERPVMSFYGSQSVRGCSAQLKLRHGKEAGRLVARQLEWARERGNDQEIAYWSAVVEDLGNAPSHRSE
ncbi:hypothetical protein [Sphingopyxis panaciterrae]